MPRSLVSLLAATGATMSALVTVVHGDLVWVTVVGVAVASGLTAYVAFPSSKKGRNLITTYGDKLAVCSYI